jgi:hypothetical protein
MRTFGQSKFCVVRRKQLHVVQPSSVKKNQANFYNDLNTKKAFKNIHLVRQYH